MEERHRFERGPGSPAGPYHQSHMKKSWAMAGSADSRAPSAPDSLTSKHLSPLCTLIFIDHGLRIDRGVLAHHRSPCLFPGSTSHSPFQLNCDVGDLQEDSQVSDRTPHVSCKLSHLQIEVLRAAISSWAEHSS